MIRITSLVMDWEGWEQRLMICFVIPLCRKCHNELHAGVKDFEEKHGSQLLLLIRFLMHARNSGVLEVESMND
ncbi:DUF968 domain-containing protein [Escherichia coli]|uniref:DUF968 domain-containing protein n=1 Tax=Escherichia coli TaxID=562 RepID=UPI003F4F22E3